MSANQNIIAIDTATEACSVALYFEGSMYKKHVVAPQQHGDLVLSMIEELTKEAKADKSQFNLVGFGMGPGAFTGVRIATSTAQALGLGLGVNVFGVSDLAALVFPYVYNEVMELEEKQIECEENADGDNQECENIPNAVYALAAIDARMGEVYYALYKATPSDSENPADCHKINFVPLISEAVGKPEEVMKLLFESELSKEIDFKNLLCYGTGIEILSQHGLTDRLFRSHNTRFVDAINNGLYPDAEAIINHYLLTLDPAVPVDPAEAMPLYCRNEVTWKKVNEQ